MNFEFRRFVAGSLLAIFASSVGAEVTYDFSGATFDTVDPPYTTGDSLSGSITLPLSLAPNLSGVDIGATLSGLTFTDGVQARSSADTAVCAFVVTTDGTGQIIDWSISLRALPLPAPGQPQEFIDSSSFGDSVGSAPAGTSPCDTVVPSVNATTSTAGSWSGGTPALTPTTYDYVGEPFTAPPPPYSATDRVSGSVTLTGPLPTLNPLDLDLAPFLIDFAFGDGVQTRTSADSAVCLIRFGTGAAGNIANWQVSLRELPLPMPGNAQQFIDSNSNFDQAGVGPAGSEPCSGFIPGLLANNSVPGDWINDPAPGPITVYQYRGRPFTTADPPYTLQNAISGSISIAGALPPNLPLTDISLLLQSLNYEDGVQTRTLADSDLCRFQVGTDGVGRIVDWRVSLRESPLPMVGEPQSALDSAPIIDQGSVIPATPAICGNAVATVVGSNSGGGTWLGGAPRSVPTLSAMALLGLMLSVGIMAAFRLRP